MFAMPYRALRAAERAERGEDNAVLIAPFREPDQAR